MSAEGDGLRLARTGTFGVAVHAGCFSLIINFSYY